MHYILKNKKPIPASLMEWAMWLEGEGVSKERIVGKTQVKKGFVSTVFIGLGGTGYNDQMFETMVFNTGTEYDDDCMRCATWKQAEKQHEKMVRLVKGEE